MLRRIRATRARLTAYLARQRQRGLSRPQALLRLPALLAGRTWAKAARRGNGRLLNPLFNRPRLRNFQREHGLRGGHYFLIVMPGTLHFLLPALALLPADRRIVLLLNGAAPWESALLRRRFPAREQLRLATLPRSSLAHGDVLTLLLRTGSHDFGVLDHDLYLFDPSLLAAPEPADNQCLLALFGERGNGGLAVPHTCFLYFNTAVLRGLMARYGVDARLYRRAPRRLQARLDALGLPRGTYLKGHHDFFDTLNLLLALGYSEGLAIGYLPLSDPTAVYHIGGTSVASPETTDLLQLYIHRRFLGMVAEPALTLRYGKNTKDARSSAPVLRLRLPKTSEVTHALNVVDELLPRLAKVLRAD